MSTYFVFQVPYQEEESQFLFQVLQTAAKAHREFHGQSTDDTELQTYLAADDAPYLLIKGEKDDHQSTPVLGSMF